MNKCIILTFLSLVMCCVESHAQYQRPIVVYLMDVTPRPIRTRSVQPPPYNPTFDSGRCAWTQECSTTTGSSSGPTLVFPMPSADVHWIALNREKMDSLGCKVKLKKGLTDAQYAEVARRANRLDDRRSTMLRELVLALPSKMDGTTYIPPSADSIFDALKQAENYK